MKISKEDFKDYSISIIIASESGEKKLVVYVDNFDNKPKMFFRVFKKYPFPNVPAYEISDFDEAINYYNSI